MFAGPQKLKHLLKLSIVYGLQRLRRSVIRPSAGGKTIVFVLDDDRLYRDDDGMGRYAYMIMNRFTDCGYTVLFLRRDNFGSYVKLGRFGRLAYSIKNLRFIDTLPDNTREMICAFDTPHPGIFSRKWKRLTFVNVLKPSVCNVGDVVTIPFFFLPDVYKNHAEDVFLRLRKNRRLMRIFFGGSTMKPYYCNPQMHRYGQMTRLESLEAVLTSGLSIHDVRQMRTFRGMLAAERYENACYIIRTDKVPQIESREWFQIISRSDFFLCLPGTDLPMCHHTIEALAMGTIPIMSYPDWFFPPLEHGKNAVIYSGREDLLRKLRDVFTMGDDEIARLRAGAAEYYDRYLTAESFIRAYESCASAVNTIVLHPKLICDEKETAAGERFYTELRAYLGAHMSGPDSPVKRQE